MVVSPNTIAKAYSELEHEGLLELRQGSGAFISVNHRARSLSNHIQAASRRVIDLVEELRERDFRDEEIRRMFEAALLHQPETVRKR
jgi:GntR family transcriptional regulator